MSGGLRKPCVRGSALQTFLWSLEMRSCCRLHAARIERVSSREASVSFRARSCRLLYRGTSTRHAAADCMIITLCEAPLTRHAHVSMHHVCSHMHSGRCAFRGPRASPSSRRWLRSAQAEPRLHCLRFFESQRREALQTAIRLHTTACMQQERRDTRGIWNTALA